MSSAENQRKERNLGSKEKKVEKLEYWKKMSLPGIFYAILKSKIMTSKWKQIRSLVRLYSAIATCSVQAEYGSTHYQGLASQILLKERTKILKLLNEKWFKWQWQNQG